MTDEQWKKEAEAAAEKFSELATEQSCKYSPDIERDNYRLGVRFGHLNGQEHERSRARKAVPEEEWNRVRENAALALWNGTANPFETSTFKIGFDTAIEKIARPLLEENERLKRQHHLELCASQMTDLELRSACAEASVFAEDARRLAVLAEQERDAARAEVEKLRAALERAKIDCLEMRLFSLEDAKRSPAIIDAMIYNANADLKAEIRKARGEA